MLRKLSIKGVKWIDGAGLEPAEVKELLAERDFHELDIEACLEENQRARIDSYDDYMFMVFRFPKYNQKTKVYQLNEFNIFLGKNYLITLKDFSVGNLDYLFNKYSDSSFSGPESVDISPGYILYEIVQAMLEKVFKVCFNIRRDIKDIEEQIFQNSSTALVKNILIKKRNIVILKHMIQPQISVLRSLEFHMKKLFEDEIEVYFEDLEDKIQKITTDITILEEYIESVEDALTSMIDIQTNNTIKFLTIFSAFMLPLTFVTSFYGMNIDLPFQESPMLVYLLMSFSFLALVAAFLYFLKRKI